MTNSSDIILALVLGTSAYIYLQNPNEKHHLLKELFSLNSHRRVSLTDGYVEVYGKKNNKYWGKIISDLGDQWQMDSKRKIWKSNLDITYYLVDTS